MTLLFKNLQNAIKLNPTRVRQDVDILRQLLQVEKFDLGFLCVDDETIRCLNTRFRKQDKPTDILSFPFFSEVKPGTLPVPEHEDEFNLGDIYVGIPYVAAACEEENTDLHDTLTILTTHGLCHLLGYNHDTEATWRQMFNRELHILHQYNQVTGSSLKPFTGVDR